MWTQRTKGRSKIGFPSVRIVNGQRGQNLTTILAISSFGTVHSKSFFGGTTKLIFREFINELSSKLSELENVFFYHRQCFMLWCSFE